MNVVVIGGGIAGVSTAWALAVRGVPTVLVEAESQLGTQSSGRSAAIFRLAVPEPLNVRLAMRSREIGRELAGFAVVTTTGGLYPCSDERQRDAILGAAAPAGVRSARESDYPAFLTNRSGPAAFSPYDGSIDVHRLLQALAHAARKAGAKFQLGSAITGLHVEGGRVRGVQIGEVRLSAEVVVDATGAFSPEFPGARQIDVGIRPFRRHLLLLDSPLAAELKGIVWDQAANIYMRPESGGILASPCDESPMKATGHVPRDAEIPGSFFARLERWAPGLASATIRNWWAGLRPLTADHRFVVGPDPLQPGLFRVGGFGGHGMTAGPAAGETAARLIAGEQVEEAAQLSPDRFTASSGAGH